MSTHRPAPARTLAPELARDFLVARHRLAPPRAHEPGPASIAALVTSLGSLQFDPLETPGARNHELVLHARVRAYARGAIDALLYPRDRTPRALFEAYNKSLNLLPVSEVPFHRLSWERARERYRERVSKTLAREVKTVLACIDAKGPQSTQELAALVPGRVPWHWAETATARVVCEALFEMGVLGVAFREGNRRWFDRVERLLPAALLEARVSPEASIEHRLLSRVRGLGLLGASGRAELFVGTAKGPERARAFAKLCADGALVPVQVEGIKGARYLLADELAQLDRAHERPAPDEVSFLAPLDPLVWDRDLLGSLFNFAYTWEVYTPEAKRAYGYYVLPMLYGARLVGRVEPVFDRAERSLRVANLWLEEGTQLDRSPDFLAALARALDAYARFVGAAGPVQFSRSRLARTVREAYLGLRG